MLFLKRMKKTIGFILISFFCFHAKSQINNRIDSVSYLIGASIAGNIAKELPEANRELLLKGLRDALINNSLDIMDSSNDVLNAYFQEKADKKREEDEKAGQIAKLEGEKFLTENRKNPKIIVTASGLQYEILKQGTGAKPTATSTVKVHYHGTTPDGRVFDSSVERGQPISFPLNQVIKGWTEGLQLMNVGSKFKFYIPQELAYGANPQPGGIIQPYMPLVFEVELIGIEK
jgi:FKBP-type peptidyl-prolyl cis-trans isomerase